MFWIFEILIESMYGKAISVHALSQDFSFSSYKAIFAVRDYSGANVSAPDFVPPPSLDFVPESVGSNMFIPKTIELRTAVNVVFKIK